MPDTRKTAKQNNGTFVTATVQGITLSSLLKKTLPPFRNPTLHNQKGGRGSVLIKMDVEGAEYGVLKQVAKSGILCDYVRYGNNATLIIEFHQSKIKDEVERRHALNGIQMAKDQLKACGVQFKRLPTFFTQ